MDKKIKETTFSTLAIRDALYFLTVALNLQKSKSKVKRPYFMSQLPELVTNQPEAGYDVLILPNPPPPPPVSLQQLSVSRVLLKSFLRLHGKKKLGDTNLGKKSRPHVDKATYLYTVPIFAPEILGFSSLFRAFFLGTLQNSPSAYSLHDRGAHCLPSLLSYLKRPGI